MKQSIIICLISLLGINSYCQQRPKLSYVVAKQLATPENINKPMALLVKGDPARVKEIVTQLGGTFKYSSGNISSVMISVNAISSLVNDISITRIEEGAPLLKVMGDDTIRYLNNIIPVFNGAAPLPKSYTGKDIIIGVIDGGLDFTHQDFRDASGNTRVKYLWDHLMPDSTNTPQPYNYGQEFSAAEIDGGFAGGHLIASVPNMILHGTVIGGIAAGDGSAVGEYIGAAPEADMVIVSINFNVSDDQFLSSIADAVDYIYSKADSLGKPCVINISAGTYFGSHDGKDLSTQLIDNLITAKNGRSLVCAMGNLGYYPLHVQTNLNTSDTLFTWLGGSAGQLYGEFWADSTTMHNLSYTIVSDKATGGYEYRGELPYTNINQHLGILRDDTIYSVDGNRLGIITSYGDQIGNQYAMYYLVTQDSINNWRIQLTGNGVVDAYSYDWLTGSSVPSSVFFSPIDYYIFPDYTQNMCSGFQCSDKTISVAQYTNMNKYQDYNNAVQTFTTTVGALHPTSSKGPTRDNRQKPDISASSEWAFGPLIVNSQPWFILNQPFKIPPTAQHIRGNGTSAASALVSGIVALYLEKYPFASSQQIKNALISCSKTDSYTGTILPNIDWGYGKVDAFNMLTNCSTISIAEHKTSNAFIICSPNPTSGNVKLRFPELKSPATLIITDGQGRIIDERKIGKGTDQFEFTPGKKLMTGIYFLKIIAEQEILAIGKLLIQ